MSLETPRQPARHALPVAAVETRAQRYARLTGERDRAIEALAEMDREGDGR